MHGMKNAYLQNRLLRLAKLLAKFAGGQASLQVLQALNGLLLVWLLAINDFAVYIVFTASTGFCSQVVGFGIMPLVVSMVGGKIHDKHLVGRYIYAAIGLRRWVLLAVAPFGLVWICFALHRMDTSNWLMFALAVAMLLSNYLTAQNDMLKAPLQMLGRVGSAYRCGVVAESTRFAAVAILWSLGSLSALGAVFIAVLGIGVNNLMLWRLSKNHVHKPSERPQAEELQLFRLASPGVPGLLFYGLQGQITVLVSSLFGTTQQVASIGALGRLARLVSFVSAANPMILGPFLSRMTQQQLWLRLPFVLGIALVIAACISAAGVLAPEWLVAVLGASYQDLESVVYLVTLGAGLSYLSGVLGTIAVYRRWVGWWVASGTISLSLAALLLGMFWLDLASIKGVLLLAIFGILARLVSGLLTMIVAGCRPDWLRSAEIKRAKGDLLR